MMVKQIAAALAFGILLPLAVVSQTIIVVVLESDKITVGSDSKRVTYYTEDLPNGKKRNYIKDTVICKIHKTLNTYYAVAGYQSDNAVRVAKECIVNNRTILAASNSFIPKRRDQILSYLTQIKADKNRSKQMDTVLKATTTTFFGFEGGLPKVIMIRHETDFHSTPIKINLVRKEFTMYPGEKGARVQLIGHTDFAQQIADLPETRRGGTRDAINKLIKRQMAGTPHLVGPPMTVIEVTKYGEKWYPSKNNCNR